MLSFVGVGECRRAARKAATRVGRSARVEGSCFQTPNLKAVSFRETYAWERHKYMITTERLFLRRARMDDLDDLHRV
ncbi:MAG TPA: hypothetical protein VFT19_05140, partial [Solirubrobacterales bacterium]|nr:hypothetical protein [Solirubrobacterales bacterium]